MNGKQYIQAAQVLPSRINEPSKGSIMKIGDAWWKNRSMLGQCAGGCWDTFDAAKLMIFS